jgi:hypothetical protein
MGAPARTAACARPPPGTRRDVYRSRLGRVGLFAFGVLGLIGTVGLVLDDAPLFQAVAVGGFALACIVLAAVPRQERGRREGVERSEQRLVFRGGRGRTAAIAFGGFAMALGSMLLLAGSLPSQIVGVFGILFFGMCGVLGIRQAIEGSYVELTPGGLAWSGAGGRFFAPWDAIDDAYRVSTRGVEELYISMSDPSRLQGSGIVMFLSGFSRRFFGAEVAIPLSQLTAHPDEVEAAVQQALAGQAFWSKSSEQELMQ